MSRAFDLNSLSSLTTVWGTSSLFVQVTVVPAATVRLAGPKLKLSIVTAADAGCPAAFQSGHGRDACECRHNG